MTQSLQGSDARAYINGQPVLVKDWHIAVPVPEVDRRVDREEMVFRYRDSGYVEITINGILPDKPVNQVPQPTNETPAEDWLSEQTDPMAVEALELIRKLRKRARDSSSPVGW